MFNYIEKILCNSILENQLELCYGDVAPVDQNGVGNGGTRSSMW
jgi:hypothetical protein